MLSLALIIALLTMAVLDGIRARILIRAGNRLDRLLGSRVMVAMVKEANSLRTSARGQPLRDFDSFRQVITKADSAHIETYPA
jgi:ABC-type protease/lipase transport system fused ATPase/permease subunit